MRLFAKTCLVILMICIGYANVKAQSSRLELDPGGGASGDLVGFKAVESGNNTTSLQVFRNFTGDANDISFLKFDNQGNIQIDGPKKLFWDPQGAAGSDFVGLKISESGNNTTKFHIYKKFTNTTSDIDLLTIDAGGNTMLYGTSKLYWNPLGGAPGDMYGIKVTESGNNTTKFHLVRNFSDNVEDVNIMTINSSGFIGIGTTTPNQRLTVNGMVYSTEVKVDLSVPGPDYVFEEDYNLPSLESIQGYIKENKHLPEVPSAREMEEKGIDLGVMNMLLLKKVEELTLHLIKQDKINKEQAEEIAELRKLIEKE
ncbi:MAG: hypothetical protein AAF843_19600 [Bacteroidota bacterium]